MNIQEFIKETLTQIANTQRDGMLLQCRCQRKRKVSLVMG